MNPYRSHIERQKPPATSIWRKVRAFFWSKPAGRLPNWHREEARPLSYQGRFGLQKRILARVYRKLGGTHVSLRAEFDGADFFEEAQKKALRSAADTAIRALQAAYPYDDTERK